MKNIKSLFQRFFGLVLLLVGLVFLTGCQGPTSVFIPQSVVNRSFEMSQIDNQGNSILVTPKVGVGFRVTVSNSKGKLSTNIADIGVTSNTVFASIVTPGPADKSTAGTAVIVWSSTTPTPVSPYLGVISYAVIDLGSVVDGSTTSIKYFYSDEVLGAGSMRLATNSLNQVIAVYNIPMPSATQDVAQYAVFSNGTFGNALSLFVTNDLIGGIRGNTPAVPFAALDNNGNALFAMSYYLNGNTDFSNDLLYKYLPANGSLSSLGWYESSLIEPMVLTTVRATSLGLFAIVSNTVSTTEFAVNPPVNKPYQLLEYENNQLNLKSTGEAQVQIVEISNTNNPKNNTLFLYLTQYQNSESVVGKYNLIEESDSGALTFTLKGSDSYPYASTNSDLSALGVNKSLCGLIYSGSAYLAIVDYISGATLLNTKIADFTPTTAQVSINDSGVVVVFYTDASGNVYTYRTTVGSGNPLVDAVKNYSRLKPQKGRF